jgi:phosphoribosylaminoimidazole-succinocarboxamide synthase
MNRRRRIYEGKAKVLYEGPEPGTLIQHFKDDATAFNAKKHEVIDGKGVLNNRISEFVFQHLNSIGVPTHFIKRLNMREQLIREVEIIPLEVVVRNVAAGSLSTRLGIEEGTQLPRSIIEFYYKNDALNDPMVSEEHITAFGWATPQEIDDIMALAIRVNDFLSGLFLGVGIRLVDFKMETGRLWEGDMMRIVVADEISPDSCRLWDIKSNDKMDKDRFRRDMGGLVEAYTEVARRLGIIGENERVNGSGPKLVQYFRAASAKARVSGSSPGHSTILSPPEMLTTPRRPAGSRAASAVAAAPPAEAPITTMRAESASGRLPTASIVACRSSAAAPSASDSDPVWQETAPAAGPSERPKPRRSVTTASQPRRARSRASGAKCAARMSDIRPSVAGLPCAIRATGRGCAESFGRATKLSSRVSRPSMRTVR